MSLFTANAILPCSRLQHPSAVLAAMKNEPIFQKLYRGNVTFLQSHLDTILMFLIFVCLLATVFAAGSIVVNGSTTTRPLVKILPRLLQDKSFYITRI